MPAPAKVTPMTLEPVHRTALLLVVILSFCGCVGCLLWEQLDVAESQSIHVDNRINPNHASIGSLIRLTGIGPVRARAIIAFREDFTAKHLHDIPFKTVQDLQQIKGIGPATIEDIVPWLDLSSDSIQR